MIEWRPPRLRNGVIVFLLLLALAATDGGVIYGMLSRSPSTITFALGLGVALSIPLLAILAYRLYEIWSLRYLLGRDSLTILCGGRGYLVPLHQIQGILHGPEFAEEIDLNGRRNGWGGWIGQGKTKGGGQVLFLATRPMVEQVALKTEKQVYALSPANTTGFILALQARRNLGPVQNIEEKATIAEWLTLPIRRDRLALGLLGVGILANILLYGYVLSRLPALFPILPMHYNAWGVVDRIEPRGELLLLPTIGLIVLIFNSLLGTFLHRREPLAAYLLLGMAITVQLVLAVAVINIIS
ncbi:MAG: hypothetical protein HYX86_05255 [Chloroflexi bacterium]|nr:hypothetical protein [Chloroflexota bacterium]